MTAAKRARLDQFLVERGMFESRSKARDAILRGGVAVNGKPAAKPGQMVAENAEIHLTADPSPYVSRAGLKLAHALDHFGIDPTGLSTLDIGASTGGFTDVLLKRDAAHVVAVDVGHGQLHNILRADPRVTVLEHLNVRGLTAEHLPQPPGLVVCDVSFISLKLALPSALSLASTEATLITLIKPQFEVGRKNLGKGGIVRDPTLHSGVCDDICTWLEQEMGWSVTGVTASPVEGSDGNREFLVCARRSTDIAPADEA